MHGHVCVMVVLQHFCIFASPTTLTMHVTKWNCCHWLTKMSFLFSEPLLPNAICAEILGNNNLIYDLQKIQSYKFPSAKPFLQQLLPLDFAFKKPEDFIQRNDLDQSLPSLPALVTAWSANHFTEGMELVENINTVVRPAYKDIKFYIIDLGLFTSQKKKV